jgi:DNA-binding NtrC family response regulator
VSRVRSFCAPQAIAANRFRQDLYYRLKVVTIVVPPLRERKEDIPALIDAFIADFNRRNAGKIRGIAPQAMARLMEHDWPGNVRELKNAVESASVLATGETIDLDAFADLPSSVASGVRDPRTAIETGPRGEHRNGTIGVAATATLDEAERVIILARLRRAGTRSATARSLGIGLRTLYAKLREYGGTTGS